MTSARTQAAKTLDAVEAENSRAMAPPGEAYRAIFPLTPAHERIFQALGALRAAEKHPGLVLWKNNRWQRHSLWDAPPTEQAADSAALQVRMLRGEHRGDAVSIANNSGKAVTADHRAHPVPRGAHAGVLHVGLHAHRRRKQLWPDPPQRRGRAGAHAVVRAQHAGRGRRYRSSSCS